MCPSEFRSAFDVLDADRDGKISRDDLRAFYSADDDAIASMISAADSDRDGFVQYHEFERVLPTNGGKQGVLEEVFRAMDRDADGSLSHQDLHAYLNSAGFKASHDDVKDMIRFAGGDANGGVSYQAFLKILALE